MRTRLAGTGLKGRKVLVVGGSKGVGAATTRMLCASGAGVACLGRPSTYLDLVTAESGAIAIAADLTLPNAARQSVEKAATLLDGLDAVVNAAAVLKLGYISEGRRADWEEMFATNVLASIEVISTAIPYIRAAGTGSIVNVGSLSGHRVKSPSVGVYAATKFALRAITDSVRMELSGESISVTLVSPGAIRTTLGEGSTSDAEIAALRQRRARSALDPADVASVILSVLDGKNREPEIIVYPPESSPLTEG